jgi:hypothetical protein
MLVDRSDADGTKEPIVGRIRDRQGAVTSL